MNFYRIEELRQERSALLAKAKQLVPRDRKAVITQRDAAEFDVCLARIDEIDYDLSMAKGGNSDKVMRTIAGTDPSVTEHRDAQDGSIRAFNSFLKFGVNGMSAEERDALVRLQRSDDLPMIRAAQSVGTGSGGGFAVPDASMQPIVEAMKSVGGVLEYAHVISSDSGADMPIPADNETSGEGEIITENTQHNEQDIALSQVVLQSYLYSSKIVRVSVQLMDDAGFNFSDYVLRKLGERLGRVTAKHWVTGTGSSQPRGISVAAPVGKTAAATGAVTYDELVDLLHSVDPIYRRNGVWVVNDTTYASFRKLKDGQSRPLYGDLANSEPNMLLGHKVIVDPNMPAMATGQKAILFGDLSRYYIRVVRGPRVLRLDERYADYLQVGFLGFLRADGDLVDTTAVKALQMA